MKTHDLVYAFRGHWDREPEGRCRVRILQDHGRPPVLIITELLDNPSTSITNLIEHLVPELIGRYLPHRFDALDEPPAIVLEHDEPPPGRPRVVRRTATYDLVSFAQWRPRIVWTSGAQERLALGEPEWRRLRPEEVWQLLGDDADERPADHGPEDDPGTSARIANGPASGPEPR